jgi:hypothetical protein
MTEPTFFYGPSGDAGPPWPPHQPRQGGTTVYASRRPGGPGSAGKDARPGPDAGDKDRRGGENS